MKLNLPRGLCVPWPYLSPAVKVGFRQTKRRKEGGLRREGLRCRVMSDVARSFRGFDFIRAGTFSFERSLWGLVLIHTLIVASVHLELAKL